jgi:hypothetical protein
MAYIPVPKEATPAWLTTVLRQSGVLKQGSVVAFDQRLSDAFNSQTSFLHLTYSADASPTVPTELVLKRNGPQDWAIEAGIEEVKFYQLMMSQSPYPPLIIRCYAADYDAHSGNSYLLLQDLSDTHAPPVIRDQQISLVEGVPSLDQQTAVIETLAQFHAAWWDKSILATDQFISGYWSRNAERFAQYEQRRRAAWQDLLEQEGDWFPPELRELYERVFAGLRFHWEHYLAPRFQSKTYLTLIHGDAYFANFLCPRPPTSGQTYLLDWQSPTVDLAGYDLVNLLATFWTPEQRHAVNREERLLRHYHHVLTTNGVTNYSWGDLQVDYQSGLIFWLLMPVQDRFGGAGRDYWWPKMECLVAAFHDWQAERLLTSG